MQKLQSTTVGQIAADTPAAARVFDGHGIDCACGGKDPLNTSCRKAGVRPDQILEEIRIAAQPGIPTDRNDWHNAPLRDLIRHIIYAHHAFLEVQLPLSARSPVRQQCIRKIRVRPPSACSRFSINYAMKSCITTGAKK